MAKTKFMELADEAVIPILYEDRSILAIDKPAGWMLVPYNWDKTSRNLQLAISSSILGREFWAKSRNIKFLKYIHRLDADTTGVLLFAKSQGALNTFGELFESRGIEKKYLVVCQGTPRQKEWVCQLKIGSDETMYGRMKIDSKAGKEAETSFRVLETKDDKTLIEASPYTGRTHQIRLHLASANLPVVGDALYGKGGRTRNREFPMGLRAVELVYMDPFTRRRTSIRAEREAFLQAFGFGKPKESLPKPPEGPQTPVPVAKS